MLLCKTLPGKNYRLFVDDLFVDMSTILDCFELSQKVFLSGAAAKNCLGFPTVLAQHFQKGKKHLNISNGQYEAMFTECDPKVVAVVWADSEKTRMLGSGAGSSESYLERRQRSMGSSQGHGKRQRLAPEISVAYNNFMGSVDTVYHLRNIRTVALYSYEALIQIDAVFLIRNIL